MNGAPPPKPPGPCGALAPTPPAGHAPLHAFILNHQPYWNYWLAFLNQKKFKEIDFFFIRFKTLRISWDNNKNWPLLEGGVSMSLSRTRPGYDSDYSQTKIRFRIYILTSICFYPIIKIQRYVSECPSIL